MNGGPAFPRANSSFMTAEDTRGDDGYEGMTLRDYFAARAMVAFLSDDYSLTVGTANEDEIRAAKGDVEQAIFDKTARFSYQMADAMLKAREVQS